MQKFLIDNTKLRDNFLKNFSAKFCFGENFSLMTAFLRTLLNNTQWLKSNRPSDHFLLHLNFIAPKCRTKTLHPQRQPEDFSLWPQNVGDQIANHFDYSYYNVVALNTNPTEENNLENGYQFLKIVNNLCREVVMIF